MITDKQFLAFWEYIEEHEDVFDAINSGFEVSVKDNNIKLINEWVEFADPILINFLSKVKNRHSKKIIFTPNGSIEYENTTVPDPDKEKWEAEEHAAYDKWKIKHGKRWSRDNRDL